MPDWQKALYTCIAGVLLDERGVHHDKGPWGLFSSIDRKPAKGVPVSGQRQRVGQTLFFLCKNL
jgi:hypothetical protein